MRISGLFRGAKECIFPPRRMRVPTPNAAVCAFFRQRKFPGREKGLGRILRNAYISSACGYIRVRVVQLKFIVHHVFF